jgi:hypothetical protein
MWRITDARCWLIFPVFLLANLLSSLQGSLSVIEAAIWLHDEAKEPGATVLALCRAEGVPARSIADMD